jgi:hypothetical protein
MNRRRTKHGVLVSILLLCFAGAPPHAASTHAQEPKAADQLPAPPPMRVIPQPEHDQLNEAKDPKAHVRLVVEFADLHLQHAEELLAQQKFNPALAELGAYLALIEDGLRVLSRLSNDRGKPRDLYKRLELALRAQGPRLTAMRRNTPLEYAIRIKEAEDFAREGRTEVLDAFYGNTVIRDVRQTKPDDGNKDTSPKPERHP